LLQVKKEDICCKKAAGGAKKRRLSSQEHRIVRKASKSRTGRKSKTGKKGDIGVKKVRKRAIQVGGGPAVRRGVVWEKVKTCEGTRVRRLKRIVQRTKGGGRGRDDA